MIIKQALQKAAGQLKKGKIKNPALEAEILLSYILKKNRELLFTYPEKKLSIKQVKNYKKLVARRLKGEPIAYLTGQKEFYGLDFSVNKNVLTPRPETELMIEEAIKYITDNVERLPARKLALQAGITLVDVGTGSGCIIISLAKRISDFGFQISDFRLFALDISQSALVVARKNAIFHKVNSKIKFIHGNLLEPIIKNRKPQIANRKLMILANLPYGWKKWKNNCSMDTIGLKFEPEIALFAGKNGLQTYEELLKQIVQLASICRQGLICLLEFDPRQTNLIKRLIKKYLPLAKLQIKKDLAGLNRLAIIEI